MATPECPAPDHEVIKNDDIRNMAQSGHGSEKKGNAADETGHDCCVRSPHPYPARGFSLPDSHFTVPCQVNRRLPANFTNTFLFPKKNIEYFSGPEISPDGGPVWCDDNIYDPVF